MPRQARIVIPHVAHHVTQRGNNQQRVFVHASDFTNYCYWMNEYADKHRVQIQAYCLMSNHVHFVVIPENHDGMSRLFNAVHMRYAQYMNAKRKTTGHLWQGRFFSCVLDDAHLYHAIRYVEQNPVRAGIAPCPWDYPWSSAKWHVGKFADRYIKVRGIQRQGQQHWREYLMNREESIEQKIRTATQKSKAVANDESIAHWETQLGRSLRNLQPGRRNKQKKQQ